MLSCRVQLLPAVVGSVLLVTACAQSPMGPTVGVMPGRGKSFEVFQADQAGCKTFAASQVEGQAENANTRAVGAAALTTVLGAGLGAAIGGGRGAGIGAASGAFGGTGVGAATSMQAQQGIQQQYDNAFAQCMYAKGHQVPGYTPTTAARGVDGASASSPLVRSVQSELQRLKYLQDTPDGVVGPRTSQAIRDFERANGMAVSGAATQSLLARLQATPASGGGVPPSTSPPPGWGMPRATPVEPSVTPAAAPSGVPPEWVAPTTRSP